MLLQLWIVNVQTTTQVAVYWCAVSLIICSLSFFPLHLPPCLLYLRTPGCTSFLPFSALCVSDLDSGQKACLTGSGCYQMAPGSGLQSYHFFPLSLQSWGWGWLPSVANLWAHHLYLASVFLSPKELSPRLNYLYLNDVEYYFFPWLSPELQRLGRWPGISWKRQ